MKQSQRGGNKGGVNPPRRSLCRKRIRIIKDTNLKQNQVLNTLVTLNSAPNYSFDRNGLKVSLYGEQIPYLKPYSLRHRQECLMKRVAKNSYSMFDGFQPTKMALAKIHPFSVAEKFHETKSTRRKQGRSKSPKTLFV